MAEEWSWARRMAQPFIESLAFTDLSGADILDLLRGEGLGYRMTEFYDDLRQYRGLAIRTEWVKRLDPASTVPRTWVGEIDPARWHQPERLRYRMEAVFRDPETGEESLEYRALMTDEEQTKEQVMQYTREVFPWDTYGEGKELVGLELVGLYHLKGTSY